MEDKKIRVAITHGDTNGIGYEMILKIFAEPEILELCTPIVYGSPKVAAYHRKALGIEGSFTIINKAGEAKDGRVNMLPAVDDEVKVDLGTPTPEAGAAALKALEQAVTDWRGQLFDVLVTAPISTKDMPKGMFPFKSQSDYIASCLGQTDRPLTILVNGNLRIALATSGLPLKDVPAAITKENLVQKAQMLHQTLRRDFRLQKPRIAILSLNPGVETDNMPAEERECILPAINELEQQHVQAFGPYPADRFFGEQMYDRFDGVLAMFDDQVMPPYRALCTETGIVLTAGLDIVHTQPDMDACHSLAGKGNVSEQSLRQAIYTAIDICRNRADYDEPMAHPLPKLYHEKRDESEKVRFAIPKAKEHKKDEKNERQSEE